MSAGWHRLSDVDRDKRRATCSQCGSNTPVSRNGSGTYRCANAHRRLQQPAYRVGVGMVCACCGWMADHQSQIDVHHRDGDHGNDEPENLLDLCANCHRLAHHAPDLFAAKTPDLRLHFDLSSRTSDPSNDLTLG